jgi:hypothetical protein
MSEIINEPISAEEPKKEKIKNKYIFPNWLADMMNKVPMRVQMESSLMSMTLLLIGMLLTSVYIAIWGGQSLVFKILLVVNMLCGFLFMGSSMVTTYQQYQSYMDTMGFDAEYEKEKIKAKGNIFKRIYLAMKERRKIKKAEKSMYLQ